MVPGQVGKVYNQIWLVGASYFVPVLQISGIQIQKYIRPFIRSWRLSALVLTPRREIPLMDSIKHPAFHSFVTGFPPRYPKADLSQNLSKSWLVPQGRELIWVCCQVLSCLRGSFWCQINLFHYLGVLHDYIGLKKGGGVLTKEGTKRRYEEEVGGGRGGG